MARVLTGGNAFLIDSLMWMLTEEFVNLLAQAMSHFIIIINITVFIMFAFELHPKQTYLLDLDGMVDRRKNVHSS